MIKHDFLVCCSLTNGRDLLHRRRRLPCAKRCREQAQQSTGGKDLNQGRASRPQGIVCKRKDAPYRLGTPSGWLTVVDP